MTTPPPINLAAAGSRSLPPPKAKAGKTVPLSVPASHVPLVLARAPVVQRELDVLNGQAAECALACAYGKPGARALLAELREKIAVAEFELKWNGPARDLAAGQDGKAYIQWKADVQTLPPEEIVAGITKDQCCHRCQHGGGCVITGADSSPGVCAHPVLIGPLILNRHQANPQILAVYRAAVAKVGGRR